MNQPSQSPPSRSVAYWGDFGDLRERSQDRVVTQRRPSGAVEIRPAAGIPLGRGTPLDFVLRPSMPTHATERLRNPFTNLYVDVDQGIVSDVTALWVAGVETFYSCQGGPAWLFGFTQAAYISLRQQDISAALSLLPWSGLRVEGGPNASSHAVIRGHLVTASQADKRPHPDVMGSSAHPKP